MGEAWHESRPNSRTGSGAWKRDRRVLVEALRISTAVTLLPLPNGSAELEAVLISDAISRRGRPPRRLLPLARPSRDHV
jgi:hypothetical protein